MHRVHNLSRQELRVEHRNSVAYLTSREENVLDGGRAEATKRVRGRQMFVKPLGLVGLYSRGWFCGCG